MGVELAALIPSWDVNFGEITDTGHLNVVGCLDKMDAAESTVGSETGTVSRLDAPRDLDTLRVANDRVGTRLGWGEDAKVVYRVDCDTPVNE